MEWISRIDNIHHAQHVLGRKFGRRVHVVKYSRNGDFIQKYSSIEEASKYNNTNSSSIAEVCRGKRKTAGNYIWKYEVEYSDNVDEFVDDRNIKVVKISKYGEAIKIYESAKEAARDCNIPCSSNISGCCKKKIGYNYAGGFIWRYADDYKNEFEPYINKTFVCATISGIFVKEYNGTRELVDVGYDLKKVLDCIEGKTDKSFGFIWGIKGEKEVCRKQRRSKPIIQMDMNGNLVKEWDSTKDASQSLGLYPQNFVKSLKRHNFVYKGFKWKFKDDDDE